MVFVGAPPAASWGVLPRVVFPHPATALKHPQRCRVRWRLLPSIWVCSLRTLEQLLRREQDYASSRFAQNAAVLEFAQFPADAIDIGPCQFCQLTISAGFYDRSFCCRLAQGTGKFKQAPFNAPFEGVGSKAPYLLIVVVVIPDYGAYQVDGRNRDLMQQFKRGFAAPNPDPACLQSLRMLPDGQFRQSQHIPSCPPGK